MASETIVSRVSSIFRGASGTASSMLPSVGTSVEQSYADEMVAPQQQRREQIVEIARANQAEDLGSQVELAYRQMVAKRLWKRLLWLSPFAIYGLWKTVKYVRGRRAAH